MNSTDAEQQRKQDLAAFEAEIATAVAQNPDYTKKEFTFSALERTLLAEQDTITALATQAKEHILNRYCLSRVAVEYSPAIKIYYSIGLGRFIVLIPKPEKTSAATPDSSSQNPS